MSCYSIPEIHQAARRALEQSRGDNFEALLQGACEETSDKERFDVMLVSNAQDVSLLVGVKQLLEECSLRVYTDRFSAQVLPGQFVTLDRLGQQKRRMGQSRTLLLITVEEQVLTESIAWMLGYFDGLRDGGVAILPLVDSYMQSAAAGALTCSYPHLVHPDRLAGMQAEDVPAVSLDDFIQFKRCWCDV